MLCVMFVGTLWAGIPRQSVEKKGENRKMMKPPLAEKIEKRLTIHGDTRIDPYYWLNERENPKTIDYLNAENSYTKAILKHTEDFQELLFKEIIGRIKQTDNSVPYKVNGYFYYVRYEEGKEYPIYCRKKETLEAAEEVMLDVNRMAEGHAYYHVADYSVSPDNKLLVFGVDTVSRRKYTLYFKNLETGEIYKDQVPNTTGSAEWADDSKTVFYTVRDETLRPHKVYRHRLGEEASGDREIYHEADETFNTGVYKTKSRKYLMIASHSTLSTEYRYLDAGDPNGEFTVVQPRQQDVEYHVSHFGSNFYIRTNWKAKNFRLMKTPVDKTRMDHWQEVIAHRDDTLLEGIEIFQDYLVVDERHNGLTELKIINWITWKEYKIDFGEETYGAGISINPEFESQWLRFNYSSLTTPYSTFDYHMESKEKKLLKQQEVVGDFDPTCYHAQRLYAEAKDGAKVPISLVYKKGIQIDGSNPLLLYGYGSYGYSMEPSFSSVRLSLLDRGFIFAIAHIRGGQEMGRYWYEDGKLLKKVNTFTDFIACGEYLVKQKYTAPEKMFAMGGSAGGLLMGAVVNMRPDLFKGIVASVPFVDVVTTMLDDSIPLTTGEYDEWGNPNEKEYYDYMLSYSPYDNVEKKDYPAMLVTTGLHDSQVQYWEPAKWVAKLRILKTDNNLLLLHTNMEAGHSGASGRFRRYREVALEYAFMFDLVGIKR
jgi:oligopeptidase B